ncbi:bifunctional oligoribonuclease/PAP phosphatase NrnA [Candidatus Desantisbacteria bacterium]|nr:bifunctional oligoribonuclease/PAP phosphatase NrnA [Candidatus Desantisbacteria bacterium]
MIKEVMESLKEIAQFIINNDNFIISSHINPDGDSTGSQLAMFLILKKLNKKVEILDADPIPNIYKFLPSSEIPKTVLNKEFDFNAAIILDCGDIKRAGELPINFDKIKTIINIDHHISNKFYGQLNYVDSEASSTGELIFRLIKELKVSIDNDIGTCLYTAIMSDTGGYKFENTTHGAFSTVAELVSYGIRPDKLSKKIYENYTLNTMHLLGLALQTLSLKAGGKISYMFVTLKMMENTSTKAEHTEGFVNHARSISGVEAGLFFRETENGTIKVSMRSKEYIDTNKIAALWNGGGHARASGCEIKGDLNTVIEKVTKKVEEEIDKREEK